MKGQGQKYYGDFDITFHNTTASTHVLLLCVLSSLYESGWNQWLTDRKISNHGGYQIHSLYDWEEIDINYSSGHEFIIFFIFTIFFNLYKFMTPYLMFLEA